MHEGTSLHLYAPGLVETRVLGDAGRIAFSGEGIDDIVGRPQTRRHHQVSTRQVGLARYAAGGKSRVQRHARRHEWACQGMAEKRVMERIFPVEIEMR